MDKLPQEAVDAIAAYLFPFLAAEREANSVWFSFGDSPQRRNSFSAGPYATISASWQRAVESLTFHKLTLLTRADVFYAEECLRGNTHRRSRVFYIRYDINIEWSARTAHLYTWRDHQIAYEFRKMIEFINRLWPATTDPALPVSPLGLLVNLAGMNQWGDVNEDLERGLTEAPSRMKELPACPAVTSLDIMYEKNTNTRGVWRPGVDTYHGIGTTSVRPTWLVEIAPKFPSLRKGA
ncbi:hypothetical protein B0H65DRAFT_592856 [Neurospora tetraspora]|uniref:Uncharacterized protein n=1 Tax=Neurospora tetraspora TaxID=94610 RepID=A0AAE0J074_9PEZI|nr:hypothetical protein B0H65DRAFT_592856 [Neurospora tetraspora]